MQIHEIMSEKPYVLCICEGNAEEDIINWLLEEQLLIFDRDDLIFGNVTRIRSAEKIQEKFLALHFEKPVIILRILDSTKENFRLGKAYESRYKDKVFNIITKPEIEILIIIHKGDYEKYTNQYKSEVKPSKFCQKEYGIKNPKKIGITQKIFIRQERLVEAIKKYNTYNKSNELCLNDILVEK